MLLCSDRLIGHKFVAIDEKEKAEKAKEEGMKLKAAEVKDNNEVVAVS